MPRLPTFEGGSAPQESTEAAKPGIPKWAIIGAVVVVGIVVLLYLRGKGPSSGPVTTVGTDQGAGSPLGNLQAAVDQLATGQQEISNALKNGAGNQTSPTPTASPSFTSEVPPPGRPFGPAFRPPIVS